LSALKYENGLQAYNPKAVGSNPTPATKSMLRGRLVESLPFSFLMKPLQIKQLGVILYLGVRIKGKSINRVALVARGGLNV
jgi:hypothetical protein